MISGTRICGKCGERAPANGMRYSIDGKRIICAKCLEIEKGGIKAGTTQPSLLKAPKNIEKAYGEKSEGVDYYCSNCHFKFSRKREIGVVTCPYCSKETIHIAPKQKAQDIINKSGRDEE